jgi:hypothetical protein
MVVRKRVSQNLKIRPFRENCAFVGVLELGVCDNEIINEVRGGAVKIGEVSRERCRVRPYAKDNRVREVGVVDNDARGTTPIKGEADEG